ncbi:MAG: FkbM family methyltransferase [Panacibacter sp.]
MFKELARNIYYTSVARYGGLKKINIFNTLLRLSLKKYFFKHSINQASEKFFQYKVLASDYPSLYFLYKEVFCLSEYFFRSTRKDPVIIDCGANIGMATLYFKHLYPEAKIIAFEASPHIYQLLKQNIENNHITNTDLYNIALYDEEKELSFFSGSGFQNLVGSVKQNRGGGNEVKIPAKKLSTYLKTMDRVDLIKMDVEGAELNIINDLFSSSLLQKADQYIIEYHHNINGETSNLSDFLKKFESNGFGYSIKTTFHNLTSFQDILLYFYKK